VRSPGIFRGFSHLGGVQQRSSTRRRGCRPSLGTAWPGSPAALLAKRASVLYLSSANRRSRPPGLCRRGPVGDCPGRPARRTSLGSSESWATPVPVLLRRMYLEVGNGGFGPTGSATARTLRCRSTTSPRLPITGFRGGRSAYGPRLCDLGDDRPPYGVRADVGRASQPLPFPACPCPARTVTRPVAHGLAARRDDRRALGTPRVGESG
jgi:hypothetical protein